MPILFQLLTVRHILTSGGRMEHRAAWRNHLLRGLVVAVFTATSLVGLVETSDASPPWGCFTNQWNVQGTQHTQGGNQTGVRADVWFGSPASDCLRVTSLAVLNGGGFVEFGWVLGWDTKNGNIYTGVDACKDADAYFSLPELFLVWQPIGGSYHCRNLLALASNQFINMWVQDPESDNVWNANYSPNTTAWTANVNFGRGDLATNGERHASSDSAFAEFKSLQFRVAGPGQNWTSFTASTQSADTDPSFHWTFISQTHTSVNHD